MINIYEKKLINYLISQFNLHDHRILISEFINDYLIQKQQMIDINNAELILYIPSDNSSIQNQLINSSLQTHQLYEEIINYLDCIQYLVSKKLIRIYNFEEKRTKYTLGIDTIAVGKKGYDEDINKLFIEYLNKAIIVKNELIKFRNNKFKTKEEVNDNFLKTTTILSLIIALVASISSVVIIIIDIF